VFVLKVHDLPPDPPASVGFDQAYVRIATPAQYGAKCNAAWTGKHGTKAYRVFKKGCVAASIAAVRAARTAGDNDSAAANRTRAVAACGVQFPAPRNTKVKRASFRACVAAAVSAEKAYGGRPLSATLAGDATSDMNGTARVRSRSTRGMARSASTSPG
jgi:hypothetical protein